MKALFPLLFLCGLAVLASLALACPGAGAPCEFDGGSYYAAVPQGWDGESELPVLVFFHGWRQTGKTVVNNRKIADPVLANGVLLIAPNGLNKTWAHGGSPSQARDENLFIDGLLADVRARWPIDETMVWASGFSQGGSMAWDAACYRGREFDAVLPAAGAFWRPHPQSCPAAPVELWHTHGTADTVVPMTGRPIGDQWRQGDVEEGIVLWRQENGCPEEPDRVEEIAGLTCRMWEHCSGGHAVKLCLHDGGHMVPPGWLETAIGWAKALAREQQAEN